ncbi:hypothetical protein ZWY2020_020659 [Hordeum vulgare]|nr:hypothetical protein ZWY2020_020659 [Hordeum vulgare]
MALRPSGPHRRPQALTWLSPKLVRVILDPGSHHGPIKSLNTRKFRSNGKDPTKLDEWFRFAALDQLEELDFKDGHMRSLPTSALRLAPMLHLAKFMKCYPPLMACPLFFYHD